MAVPLVSGEQATPPLGRGPVIRVELFVFQELSYATDRAKNRGGAVA